ncbi:hypothetical protein D6T51_07955 [Salmonella enterica subsp. enterica serovar Muenchen]|nr:hypothetical protein [Salmonella enterica subsp. enterica serovar Muenchen]
MLTPGISIFDSLFPPVQSGVIPFLLSQRFHYFSCMFIDLCLSFNHIRLGGSGYSPTTRIRLIWISPTTR